MSADLAPGDRVKFPSKSGLLMLRGVVADALVMKVRGEELLVPVSRTINRHKAACAADRKDHEISPPQVRWIPRSRVRKLPPKAEKEVTGGK